MNKLNPDSRFIVLPSAKFISKIFCGRTEVPPTCYYTILIKFVKFKRCSIMMAVRAF